MNEERERDREGEERRVKFAYQMLMEEHFNPTPIAHLLQHSLRSLCTQENSLWVYAIFWRILPRNYPPPNWGFQGGSYDKSRRNKRNWILVWEDGFCNFAASMAEIDFRAAPSVYRNCELQYLNGLQPELFFKMSHEIYNYGEGLIGKVAADNSHKWVYKQHSDQEINLSAWQKLGDSYPRTWRAQFQSGIKTIALIAVKEGVLQLGAVNKVTEDLSYVFQLQRKFNYLQSIPGFLLPRPSSSSGIPFNTSGCSNSGAPISVTSTPLTTIDIHDHFNQPVMITPSMSSLEELLSKLPSVVPTHSPPLFLSSQKPLMDQMGMEVGMVAKERDEWKENVEKDLADITSRQQCTIRRGPYKMI